LTRAVKGNAAQCQTQLSSPQLIYDRLLSHPIRNRTTLTFICGGTRSDHSRIT